MRKHTFRGGIHPLKHSGEGKEPTRNVPVRSFAPEEVVIPMSMHLGAPSIPLVKKGDHVKIGQIIGEGVGGLGVAIHASISGEVIDVGMAQQLGKAPCQCVTIKNDFQNEREDRPIPGQVESIFAPLIVPNIQSAGVCGMGGAGFPTHVKLTMRDNAYCDTVVLNGAECETHITADYRLMVEEADRVADGLRLVMRALGADKGVVAIEDNKPEAIAAMEKAAKARRGIRVAVLKTKYPQGGEKQLIEAVTNRQVPQNGLPVDAHVVVVNVATAAAICDAITKGDALTKRIVTVTGHVKEPGNLLVPIGTRIADLVEACGGYSREPGKIVSGGAMTGIAVPDAQVSVTKTTNGIIVFDAKEAVPPQESACIRCGRCHEVCPIGLQPSILKYACDVRDWKRAEELHVMDCVVCGSCSYICPAHRQMAVEFRLAKERIAAARRKQS